MHSHLDSSLRTAHSLNPVRMMHVLPWRWCWLFAGLFFLTSSSRAEEAARPPAPPPITVEVTGSGRPMLLIPGLSCGGQVWDGTVAHFKDRYQCHVVTLAGFAGQPAIGAPMLEKVRDALHDYVAANKLDRPVVIGHSLGAFLSYWLGSKYPDAFGPIIAVDGLPFFSALRDPSATPASVQGMAQMLWMGLQMQTPAQYARANRTTLTAMITDPKDLDQVAKISAKSDPKAVAQALFELMTIDLRPEVKNIKSPVLLLGATANAASDPERKTSEERYREQVSTIPNHRVVFAPRARHFIQLDEPEFFYREVETFLGGM